MATLMHQSMTADDTFCELKKFERRRKPEIRGLSRLYRDRGIPSYDSEAYDTEDNA